MDLALKKPAHIDTSGNHYLTVLKLAMPTTIAMLLQSFVAEVEAYCCGRLPGAEGSNAQAALAPSLIMLWFFGGSLSALSIGTQAMSARRYGEGRDEETGRVLTNLLVFGLAAALIDVVLANVAMPHLMHLTNRNSNLADKCAYAISYSHIRYFGIPSMVLTFVLKAFFDGIGRTRLFMTAVLVMNTVNCFLLFVMTFGWWGVPFHGITGAAYADLFSTWIGMFIMFGFALHPENRARFRWLRRDSLSWSVIGPALKLSIPGGGATMVAMLGFGFFFFVVSKIDHSSGAILSAATTAIVMILKLTFTSAMAFGTSTATLVSYSLGEKKPEQAAEFGWTSVKLAAILFTVIGLLEGLVFPHQLLHFMSDNPAVQTAAFSAFQVVALSTPIIAVGMILTQALFGAGDNLYVLVVELLMQFLVLCPLAWIMGVTLGLGLFGIWLSAAIYVVGLSAAMVARFAGGSWKKIKV